MGRAHLGTDPLSVRRFRVDDVPNVGDQVSFRPSVEHHVTRVLRLGPGSSVQLFDGNGKQAMAELVPGVDGIVAQVTGAPSPIPRGPTACLVLALLKPGPMDDALRMATEAGASRILIFQADRSQSRPPRDDRWRRVVEAAARQCGRPDDPAVTSEGPLRAALGSPALISATEGGSLYVAAPGGSPLPSPSGPAAIIVGPEGGLTQAELLLAEKYTALAVSLGPWILRAETAAACATAWMTSSR